MRYQIFPRFKIAVAPQIEKNCGNRRKLRENCGVQSPACIPFKLYDLDEDVKVIRQLCRIRSSLDKRSLGIHVKLIAGDLLLRIGAPGDVLVVSATALSAHFSRRGVTLLFLQLCKGVKPKSIKGLFQRFFSSKRHLKTV